MQEQGQKYKVAVLVNKDMFNRVLSQSINYLKSFAEVGDMTLLPEKIGEEYMKAAIKDADACITCWKTPKLTESILSEAPGLKLLAHSAGSIKAVTTDDVWNRGIRVTSAAPIIAIDVAETALALIITSLKRLWQYNGITAKGYWSDDKEVRDQIEKAKRLHDGVRIGIIGASHVGRNLIQMLKVFKVEVLLYDPYVNEQQAAELGVKKAALDELMSQCDAVSLHAPNIPQTYHMINKQNLALMRDGAVFVNTARGAIVDELALIDELKTGRLFACIDVTDPKKPAPDSPLRHLDNVILTPHIAGGHTFNGRQQQGSYVVSEVYNFLTEGKLKYEVTRDMVSYIA